MKASPGSADLSGPTLRSLLPRSLPSCATIPSRRRHVSKTIWVYFFAIALLVWPTAAFHVLPPDLQPAIISARGEIVDSRPRSTDYRHEPHHQNDILTDAHPLKRSTEYPQPFDTSLSNNFTTSSCPAFFSSFLANQTVASCHALSLLLRDSSAYFHILSSAPQTSRVLDAACGAPFDECKSIFSSLAEEIASPSNCQQDLQLGNPIVSNALSDFQAYEAVYKSTCLTSPDSNNYCFVDAVFSNKSADYDIYFIPLGVNLSPQSGNLTCGSCLQATMGLFGSFAGQSDQPLAESYLPSATVVDQICGSGFADLHVSVASAKAAVDSSSGTRRFTGLGLANVVVPIVVGLGFGLF